MTLEALVVEAKRFESELGSRAPPREHASPTSSHAVRSRLRHSMSPNDPPNGASERQPRGRIFTSELSFRP